MDTLTLRMFRLVAESGSISAAARQMNYAQSNVSTKISQLEEELGTHLFHRTNRGIRLTGKGEIYLRYATDILRLESEAGCLVKEDTEPAGPLRIASMQTTAQTFLPGVLSEYHRVYPKVELSVACGTSRANISRVLDYEADCAFAVVRENYRELETVPAGSEHLVLLTDAAFDASDMAGGIERRTLLVFPEGCSYRRCLEDYLKSLEVAPLHAIEFDSTAAILAAVCAGAGISLLPEAAAKSFVTDGYLAAHEIPGAFSDIETGLVTRRDAAAGPALRKFFEMVKKAAEKKEDKKWITRTIPRSSNGSTLCGTRILAWRGSSRRTT